MSRSVLRPCLLLLAVIGLLPALSIHLDQTVFRQRPGQAVDIPYTLGGFTGNHNITCSDLPTGVTATPASGTGAAGTIRLSIPAAAIDTTATVQIAIANASDAGDKDTASVQLVIDVAPILASGQTFTVAEDAPASLTVKIQDLNIAFLSLTTVTGTDIAANGTPTLGGVFGIFQVPVLGRQDFFGTATLRVTVVDLIGPTVLDLPVTVTPVNDPPAVALSLLPTPRMDPATGAPVALLDGMAVSKGVDADVTVANAATRLAFRAQVDGLDGVDLLGLCGDAGYRVDAGSIAVLPAGTAIATWTLTGTRTIDVTLTASGTLAHLQDLVRLLRYSRLQNANSVLTRTVTITVIEPDPAGGTDPAVPRTATCQVAAVDLPPVAELQPLEVEPLKSAALVLAIVDQGGLDKVTVSVAAPAPLAGRVEPASCRGDVAVAGGLRYLHTANDLSDDRIVLAVDDHVNPPVLVAAAVAVRLRPDRLSILSDPLLEVVRGAPIAHRLATLPAAATLQLVDYGDPLPKLPAGVTLAAGVLSIDWKDIPAGTAWIGLAVEATTGDTSIPPGSRSARQAMLIHVREPAPTGTAD